MSKNNIYFSTKDKIRIDLSQEEMRKLHAICNDIFEVCEYYIRYLYNQAFKYITTAGTVDSSKLSTYPKWHSFYKNHIATNPDFFHIKQYMIMPYLYEIDRNFERVIYEYVLGEKLGGGKFTELMFLYCKKVYALSIRRNSSDRLLVIKEFHHNTLTKINNKQCISIPGIRKHIPLKGTFKPILGDDTIKQYFINITKPDKNGFMKAWLNLGFGTKENPYFDIDGFINLRKKKKGSKSDVWKKERID